MYITRAIRDMEPTRYTKEDAAALVGVSLSTIKRWKENDLFVPTESRQFGNLVVDLYTPEDIPVLLAIKANSHPGRKKGIKNAPKEKRPVVESDDEGVQRYAPDPE